MKYQTKKQLKENDHKSFEAMGKRKLYDCFFDKDGNINENIKHIKINSEEYNKLKNIVDEKIKKYLEKHSQQRK